MESAASIPLGFSFAVRISDTPATEHLTDWQLWTSVIREHLNLKLTSEIFTKRTKIRDSAQQAHVSYLTSCEQHIAFTIATSIW